MVECKTIAKMHTDIAWRLARCDSLRNTTHGVFRKPRWTRDAAQFAGHTNCKYPPRLELQPFAHLNDEDEEEEEEDQALAVRFRLLVS